MWSSNSSKYIFCCLIKFNAKINIDDFVILNIVCLATYIVLFALKSCGGDWWQMGTYTEGKPKELGSFAATPGWEDVWAQTRIDQGYLILRSCPQKLNYGYYCDEERPLYVVNIRCFIIIHDMDSNTNLMITNRCVLCK